MATILVVDDEDSVRRLCHTMLELSGFRVLEASSAEEAKVLLQDLLPIDLLITDVLMPGMGGTALVQEVLRDHPSVRILYISGSTGENRDDNRLMQQHIREYECAFLPKPFTTAMLMQTVRQVLQGKPRRKYDPAVPSLRGDMRAR